MAENASERIIRYLQDAHAAENGIADALEGFIDDTDEPNLRAVFQDHLAQTRSQMNRLEGRLRELGESPSGGKGFLNSLMAKASEIMHGAHDVYDKNTQNLVKAYATEHMERAMYESLYTYATAIGDTPTAQIARAIQMEEEQTAQLLWPLIGQYAQTAVNASRGASTAYPA